MAFDITSPLHLAFTFQNSILCFTNHQYIVMVSWGILSSLFLNKKNSQNFDFQHFVPFFLTFILGLFSVRATAQSLYTAQQQRQIQQMRVAMENNTQVMQAQLLDWAKQQNISIRQVFDDGSVMLLSGLTQTGHPLYEITHTNSGSALTTRTNALYQGGGLGLNLNGSSSFLRGRLGVWDGGAVLATHAELTGRVEQRDGVQTVDGHATHVSGTMIASGVNPRMRGMAHGASLLAYDFNNDNAEMANAAADLLISNHSYGTLTGWRFNSARPGTNNNLKWEWYGDSTINEQSDFKFGLYNDKAREWDRIAYNAPYYLIVSSAGNNRGSNGPPAGTPYFLGSSNRTSTTPRATQNGYELIATQGNAKNNLTVGAISVLNNGYNLITDPRISSFSSWGPTDDGRIKPDIVGVGVGVISSTSTNNNAYTTLSGTSMSTPNVSGSLLLLQELHRNLRNDFMRSATLKGLILHTADDAGNVGPDYQYGWGLLNMRQAAAVMQNTDQSHQMLERTLMPNETFTLRVVASGKGPLTATICWTDPEAPAPTATAANFNNRTPKLINDLDLRITDGATESLPWVLNPEQPAALATRGDNIRDNVEQVFIANAIPGQTYTITVKHKGALTNNQQPYALFVSGIGGKAYCESRATSETGLKITRVTLGNITQNANNGCQTYSNFMQQVAHVSAGRSIPMEVGVGTCTDAAPAIVKAYIDWNLDGDFEDTNELVATSGVLSGNVTFRPTFSVPNGLRVGQYTRLRIVCVESNDPNAVNACGTYLRGETQEYLVKFVNPSQDVALTALVSPENSSFCSGQPTNVTIRVRNNGLQPQTNVPIEVEVRDSQGQRIGLMRQTLSQTLPAFNEVTTSLTADFLSQLQAGQNYQFICRTRLTSDQDTLNDVLIQTRTVAAAAVVRNATATYCDSDPASLISRAEGVAYWYDTPSSPSPLAIGNFASSERQPNNTFYVALNEFRGAVGPTTKAAFTGGSYSGTFGPQPLIKTEVPLVLESARLYTASAGKITFTVQGLDDSFVATTTIDTRTTRNANAPNQGVPAGQATDDPNDVGEVYPLNLTIPRPGDYKISIEYDETATIFRSNAGVTGFPFRIPNVITLRGALFAQNNRVDTITNAYYYLYDLKVKALGCPSPRVAITAQTATKATPTVSFDGLNSICEGGELVLKAPTDAGVYQWFLNNQPIRNASAATYNATMPGTYAVSTSVNNCLPTRSMPIMLATRRAEKPTVTVNGIILESNVVANNQWFLNGLPISGATNRTLTALQTGNYAVRANANGCGELLSDDVRVVITSLEEEPTWRGVGARVYPNPTQDRLICEFQNDNASNAVTATLIDNSGRILKEQKMEKVGKFFRAEFNLQNLENGTFFAVVQEESAETRTVLKIVKKL